MQFKCDHEMIKHEIRISTGLTISAKAKKLITSNPKDYLLLKHYSYSLNKSVAEVFKNRAYNPKLTLIKIPPKHLVVRTHYYCLIHKGSVLLLQEKIEA